MTARIPLSRGLFAIVDEDDAGLVTAAGPWHSTIHGRNVYARRNVPLANGRRTTQLMHVLLMGETGVDHINGDGLDNRRLNLRLATKAENSRNRRPNQKANSGFKGVSWHKATQKFRAQIHVEGQRVHLGLFVNPIEAAKAYDAAARAAFGRFAHPNFANEESR